MEIIPKEPHESAKEYVLRTLTDNIVHTRLKPGQKLLEQELCQELNVSRTPLREAMMDLVQWRLVEVRPKVGSYVSRIDPAVVEQVRHLRSILEAELVAMACTTLSQAEIGLLRENLSSWQTYAGSGQEEKIYQLDKRFYQILYRSCGRMYWYHLLESAAPHFDRTAILTLRCRPLADMIADREALVRALEARDPQAARAAIARHMERYCESLHILQQQFPDYFVPSPT